MRFPLDFQTWHMKAALAGSTLTVVALSAAFGLRGLFLGVGLVFAVASMIAILFRPWTGIVLIALLLPFERVGSIEIGSFTLRLSQIVTLYTLGITILFMLLGGIRFKARAAIVPLLLFFLGVLTSFVSAENMFRAGTTSIFFLFTMSLAFLIPTLITTRERMVIVLRALLAGALLTSLFGLFQFAGDLAGLPQEITGLRDLYTKDVFGFPRIQSTALEPLYFANFLLLPIALCVVVIVKRFRPLLTLSLMTLPVALPVFVLTLSRAAYIAAAVMFFILAIFLFRHFFNPSRIIVFVMLGFLTFSAVTYALSLTGEEDVSMAAFTRQASGLFIGASFADRVQTTEQSLALFKQHPFGIGPGNFGPAIADHPLIEPEGGWLIVNNIYLEVLAEEGLLGLAGFLAFAVFVLVGLFRMFKRGSDFGEQVFRISLFAACVAILLQYATFSILYIMHIWFVFGLALTLHKPLQEHG